MELKQRELNVGFVITESMTEFSQHFKREATIRESGGSDCVGSLKGDKHIYMLYTLGLSYYNENTTLSHVFSKEYA